MRKSILSFIIAIFAVFAAQAQNPVHKVVIQLNTSDTLVWHGALKNISNLQTALGKTKSLYAGHDRIGNASQ